MTPRLVENALEPPRGYIKTRRGVIPWLGVWMLVACQQGTANAPPAASQPPTASALASPSASPAAPVSQREEPPLPEAREESAAGGVAGRLYLVGGFDVQGRSRAESFVFDGSSWKPGPALPLGLDHPAAATFDNVLYVGGGFSNGPASARLFKLEGDRWTELAPLHHPRGALALVGADDALWALAGLGPGGEVGPAERYEIATNTWTDLSAIPRPRDHVAGFGWQQQVCAAGGRSPNTAEVDCLDTATRQWAAGPPLPMPTSGAGGGALGNPVVAGGEDPQETRLIDVVARLKGGSWTSEPMLHPRHGIQLAVFQGRLWACGGGEQAGLHPVATCTSIEH